MSGSDDTTTTTTNVSNEPWAGQSAYYSDIFAKAKNLAASGAGFTPYQGSTYVPPNTYEYTGLQNIYGNAMQGTHNLGGLLAESSAQLQGKGFAAPLSDIASGKYQIEETGIGRNNADFTGMVDRAVRKGVDEATGLFSAGGRYGGGAHQGTVTETAAGTAGDLYAEQYNKDVDTYTKQRAANIANRAGASQALLSQYNSLAGNADALDDLRYKQGEKLVDVGAALRAESQAQLDAHMQQYEDQQAAQRKALEWYNSIIGGSGSLGGSSTSTESVPKGSAISGILGTAASGAGILGSLGGLFGL